MGGKQKRHMYKQYKHDIVRAMFNSSIRWNRRLLIPMFHPDHIREVAKMMTECGEVLRRLSIKNSLTRVEKLIQAQWSLDMLSGHLKFMKPTDPRDRGGEEYEYQGDGFQTLTGLEDLDKIINNTLGEEDEGGDHIMWNTMTRENIQRAKDRDQQQAHFKHNQPPEEKDGLHDSSDKEPEPAYSAYKKGKFKKFKR